MLSRVVTVLAVLALATELTVMIINGEVVLGYVAISLSCAGILVIFRYRWTGLALTAAGAFLASLVASENVGIWSVAVFAMFLFAARGPMALAAGAGVALTLYLGLVIRADGDVTDPSALAAASSALAAAAAGSVVRLQTESWGAARQRAIDLAAEQQLKLRQAVTDERLRIARDLHDAVGHELAVVNIHVGVAEVSLPDESARARGSLQSAREAIQRALEETRQILDVLRAGEGDLDARTELAVLEHIPSLIARVMAAGAQVESNLPNEFPELDADVSAAAYRIVQESLTNAEKHGAGPAHLSIAPEGSSLVIDISNRPSAATAAAESRHGYGIVGMRERVLSAGGTIDIRQNASAFAVHVELPLKGRPA